MNFNQKEKNMLPVGVKSADVYRDGDNIDNETGGL